MYPPTTAGRLTYTVETPSTREPGSVFGAWVPLRRCPRLRPFPPRPPLWASPIVRPLPRYYERIRLLVRVDGGITAVPSPPHPVSAGCGRNLPGPAQKASRHAQGLRPRGIVCGLAINARIRVAFRLSVQRRHPEVPDFAAQWLACRFPLSTLGATPHGVTPMTRGRNESPFLFRIELSSTTFCQFVLAHHRQRVLALLQERERHLEVSKDHPVRCEADTTGPFERGRHCEENRSLRRIR